MKKLFLLLVATCMSIACNKSLTPEETTRPELGEVTFRSQGVRPGEPVEVSLPVYGRYGIALIYTSYILNDADPTIEGNVKTVGIEVPNTNREQDITYTADIPGQAGGTKVSFQVIVQSYYGPMSWTDLYEYTVDGADDVVDPTPAPER